MGMRGLMRRPMLMRMSTRDSPMPALPSGIRVAAVGSHPPRIEGLLVLCTHDNLVTQIERAVAC